MCDIDVGKCCDIDVQEQAIELLIRNHGGDVLWPQPFAFSRRQTCVARKNWERAFVRGVMSSGLMVSHEDFLMFWSGYSG